MARSEVRGSRRIAANLRALARGIGAEDVETAHQQALTPMQASAQGHFRANGSFVTGVIPENIVIVKTGARESKLTMSGMGAKLGHIIELGTDPHEQPNRGIVHPGAQAKPFMTPAFEDTKAEAMQTAGRAYADILSRIARTLR